MTQRDLTRRQFLVAGGTLAATTLIGRRAGAARSVEVGSTRIIYRLSLRGRRGSKAGKLHNANLRFATAAAADANRAHPGDNSRIVALVVSGDEYDRLSGSRNLEVADLRALGGPALVGDCNRNGQVVSSELIAGVNIALGAAPVSVCKPFDRSDSGDVTVDELVRGTGNAI